MLLNFTQKKIPFNFLGGKIRSELLFDPFCRTVSRLQYKPDLFLYEQKSEYLPSLFELKMKSLTWEQCCTQRAEELLRLNRSQYIFSWSGGIDSTVMMVSILKVWPRQMLDKIIVSMSHSSLYENPFFYDRFLSNLKTMSSMQDMSTRLINKDALLLTGELGDQLFGSDMVAPSVQSFGEEVLWKNFEDWAPRVIEQWTRREGTGKVIFEHFHPIVKESPVEIRTVFDFFWWLNFSQKWQHVKYRFVEQGSWDLDARYGKEILHFFDSKEFQKWSVENHDLKINKKWSSYKLAAKEYIADYTKNKDVLLQPKVPSLALRNFLVRKRRAVTSDYVEIKSDEELEQYVR